MLLKMRARAWRHAVLLASVIASRVFLIWQFNIELSQDGFDAVNTLTLWQTQGIAATPHALVDRFILHPLYMLLLAALKLIAPGSFDFFLTARLFSTLLACVAIILMFELARCEYGEIAGWIAALLLAFAPSFLWESISILSSTLFLVFYLAVLFALVRSHFHRAAAWALLGALTRYEGIVLIAIVLIALLVRDLRARAFHRRDWIAGALSAIAFPIMLVLGSVIATGNPFDFMGAQSMAQIWLRVLAPDDVWNRAAFFLTRYPALFPAPVVWLGTLGALAALTWHRSRATGRLFLVSLLYLAFYEILVLSNYTTLEVRFLMYPGLPLLIFAGIAIARIEKNFPFTLTRAAILATVIGLIGTSAQQSLAGMRFIYNMHASQSEVAAELARLAPSEEPIPVLVYGGAAGALDFYAHQFALDLETIYFRFAPDENPEQYVIDHAIRFVIYPVGNAFAHAKFPYLARFEPHRQRGVTFQPLAQFSTTLDHQTYLIFAVSW